jgi:uncharacterized protein YjiS (DUF1127 family)
MSVIENGEILVRYRSLESGSSTFVQRLLAELRKAALWPARALKARRELEMLAMLSERDLKDIGLTRSDLGDITALPADVSPTDFLAARIEERALAKRA